MTVADLMVSMDIWPPGVLPMFKSMAPASSLTWHLTYVHPLKNQLHDWMKYHVETQYAADGYSTEAAYLWDDQNRLIAISRQTVTVFA
jgi:acyl-CoA thioesterase